MLAVASLCWFASTVGSRRDVTSGCIDDVFVDFSSLPYVADFVGSDTGALDSFMAQLLVHGITRNR